MLSPLRYWLPLCLPPTYLYFTSPLALSLLPLPPVSVLPRVLCCLHTCFMFMDILSVYQKRRQMADKLSDFKTRRESHFCCWCIIILFTALISSLHWKWRRYPILHYTYNLRSAEYNQPVEKAQAILYTGWFFSSFFLRSSIRYGGTRKKESASLIIACAFSFFYSPGIPRVIASVISDMCIPIVPNTQSTWMCQNSFNASQPTLQHGRF